VFRQKSHSSLTGYVYQYYYEGRADAPGGSRYVFHATADRRTYFPLAIFVPDAVIAAWEQAHRELTVNERYAVAKLALIAAFDELPPGQLHAEFEVTTGHVDEIAVTLGWL
jgi:hypothetical protein